MRANTLMGKDGANKRPEKTRERSSASLSAWRVGVAIAWPCLWLLDKAGCDMGLLLTSRSTGQASTAKARAVQPACRVCSWAVLKAGVVGHRSILHLLCLLLLTERGLTGWRGHALRELRFVPRSVEGGMWHLCERTYARERQKTTVN